MSQTRKGSLIESVVNVAVGYGIGLVLQLIVFAILGVSIPFRANLAISGAFTGLSIVRSYTLRRIFNSFRKL